jgi:protein-S-isoprenylcysteine O-methyltransferase Ste14
MRATPPFYFMSAIVVMAVCHGLVPVIQWLPSPWNLVGIAPLFGGIALAFAANRLFSRHGTPIHPFADAVTLVTEGPFAFTRNPMYLGLTLALAGIATLLGTLTPWLAIPAFVWIITQLFIRREERALEARFGEAYATYKRSVRRWI